MTQSTRQNVSNGRWAVAWVGYRGWKRYAAIGDGITSATACLVTRCNTKSEAVALAERLNDAQPAVLPGSKDVAEYEARPYRQVDYISEQDMRNGYRDVDRRIMPVYARHLHFGIIC